MLSTVGTTTTAADKTSRLNFHMNAVSGYSYTRVDKYDFSKGISIKIARMHNQFQQSPAPSVQFSEGFSVCKLDWIPQGQSIQEKEALDETHKGRVYDKEKDKGKVYLHSWPTKSSWKCMTSTFFVMQLDTRLVLGAINLAEMKREVLTKFAKYIVDSFEQLQVPTPAGYRLEKTDIVYKWLYHCEGFCHDTACANKVEIEFNQQVNTCRGGGRPNDSFTHAVEIYGYANNERIIVVGRGEGWRVLQRFACEKFAIAFGKTILSERSWRKDAQLDLLQSRQSDLDYPSREHVKGFMDADCEFTKKLMSLGKFEPCSVYHYEDMGYTLSNNNLTDSSSGGEEEFEHCTGIVKSSKLVTLPIKVGVGRGLVKICVPISKADFRQIADFISTTMTD